MKSKHVTEWLKKNNEKKQLAQRTAEQLAEDARREEEEKAAVEQNADELFKEMFAGIQILSSHRRRIRNDIF